MRGPSPGYPFSGNVLFRHGHRQRQKASASSPAQCPCRSQPRPAGIFCTRCAGHGASPADLLPSLTGPDGQRHQQQASTPGIPAKEHHMELRTLRYFLAVAQAKTISAAAEALHVTQPTLSRQMQELEEELGKTLFLRGKRSITLTEEGTFFRKRAQEVVSLLEKTTAELRAPDELLSGDIHIGGGETDAIRLIARAARRMRQDHPHVTFHIFSGNAEDVMEKIDRDLVDFGLFIEPVDLSGYEFFRLPVKDRWGVLMRKDAPLAARPSVAPADLRGLPLLVSRQNMVNNEVAGWLGETHDALQVVATYNLLYSASIMVEEGMGYALCLDRIIRLPEDGPLCFRPLHPAMEVGLNVAWKKQQLFSKPARVFLDYLKASLWGGPAAEGASATGTPQDDLATA